MTVIPDTDIYAAFEGTFLMLFEVIKRDGYYKKQNLSTLQELISALIHSSYV